MTGLRADGEFGTRGNLRPRPLPVLAAAAIVWAFGGIAEGALIRGNYQLSTDRDVDKTVTGRIEVRKFKQSLELKYRGLLSPVVQNEVTFRFEQEIDSSAADITRFLPTLDLGFKGKYWEAKSGAKRSHENSDEPGRNPKVTDNYFVELFYMAPRNVPDLKAKYTLDKDTEAGVTDTSKQGIALSSSYKPNDWLDIKGDYTRNTSKDNLTRDADTEDEKANGTVSFRHVVSERIKVNAQYTAEESRGATLLSGGGATGQKRDQTHTIKSTLSFRPLRATSVDASYDIDLRQNMVTNEHTQTNNAKVAVSQKIGKPFDLKGDFSRNITEARHTADDNQKTEDIWTVDFHARFSKQLDFTLKYQAKETVEEYLVDPRKDTTSGTTTRSGSWTGELAPFWNASASADITDTLVKGAKTVVDTKYSLKSTFDFKAINLSIVPTYEITFKEDLLKIPAEKTETRDFKFQITDKIFSTRTMEGKIDHTYGRKTDSGARNVQRTDSTTANLAWTRPFPGWTFAFDATRSATDTSEDDIPPDITSTFGFRADYKMDRFSMNASYKYDKKSLTDNSETFDFKTGWTAPKWDISLTYNFTKTFSVAVNEGYTISLAFKYNL